MAMAAALLLFLLAAPVIYAEDHIVGGSTSGWDTNVDYTTWAAGETFTSGDNLVFIYGATHSVDEVSKGSYDSCATSNPIKSYTGGNNSVPLTAAGSMYFLCPTAGHCSQGMKLAITVVASTGGSTPPTTPSPPSSSGSPGSPSPPTTSSSSPPPPPNGAAGKSGGMSGLTVGLVVGLGTVITLMV